MKLLALAALAAAVTIVSWSGGASAAGTACPTSNPPNELVLSGGSGQTAQLGKQFPASLKVQLANTNGCQLTGNLAGINVDFDAPSTGPSGIFDGSGSREAVVGTDSQGAATAPAFTANFTSGSYTVDAHSDYGTVELFLSNTAAALPAAIAAASGSGQAAAVNGEYAQPLQARVTDANGTPVQGATVSFAVVPGPTGAGATFLGGQATATTDSNGLATSPPLYANGVPGRFDAVASVAGVTGVADYAFDNHAAPATIAAVTRATLTARVGTSFRRRLQARVLDASGQPIEGASVIFQVAATPGAAGASFVGGGAQATVLTGANGVATSPVLSASTTAGPFTATATATGAASVATYRLCAVAARPATVAAGAASGETTATRTRFPVPLAVTVTDRYGNAVAGVVVVFAAPRRGPSGSFAHAGRVARVTTNADGIAVAPRLTANGIAGGYVVTAAVRGTRARTAFALVNDPR